MLERQIPLSTLDDRSATPVLRCVIGIPTTGRAPILSDTLRHLAKLHPAPSHVFLAIADESDVEEGILAALPYPVTVLPGPKGGCVQRNRILKCLSPQDVLLLLDDDFLPALDYLAECLRVFTDHPDVAMATGTVIADGVTGPGFSTKEGLGYLIGDTGPGPAEHLRDVQSGYGCNMAVRATAVIQGNLSFDEKLPLYSWLEDVDFTRQLLPMGRLVRVPEMRGVHLGTKTSRTPGKRLGYSQVANPIYLMRKGTMTREHGIRIMFRNMGANLLYSFKPRPWTDNRGRLLGNLMALRDLALFRLDPGRVVHMK